MVRAQRTQLKLVTAAFIAGTVAIACGGGDDDKGGKADAGTPDDGEDSGVTGTAETLTLSFNPMYSAFDGQHTFKLPVQVKGATGKLTVKTDPPDFVDSEPASEGVVTLTTRKAGDAMVIITDAAGNSGKAELHVTKNDPGDVDLGKDRYSNGVEAFPEGGIGSGSFPEGGFGDSGITFVDGAIVFPEGGFRFPEGGGPLGNRNPESACTFCHIPDGQNATGDATAMMRVDVEHTPQQTAGYSDEDLIKIFSDGVKPTGSTYRVVNGGDNARFKLPDNIAAGIYAMFHKWNVEPAVKKGIVAYLRQITPKPQGPIDFGGLLPPRMPRAPRADGGTTTATDAGSNAAADTGASTADTGAGTADTGAP